MYYPIYIPFKFAEYIAGIFWQSYFCCPFPTGFYFIQSDLIWPQIWPYNSFAQDFFFHAHLELFLGNACLGKNQFLISRPQYLRLVTGWPDSIKLQEKSWRRTSSDRFRSFPSFSGLSPERPSNSTKNGDKQRQTANKETSRKSYIEIRFVYQIANWSNCKNLNIYIYIRCINEVNLIRSRGWIQTKLVSYLQCFDSNGTMFADQVVALLL